MDCRILLCCAQNDVLYYALIERVILSPNRNLTVLPSEIVPYFVAFLSPFCSAKAALSGTILPGNPKALSIREIGSPGI